MICVMLHCFWLLSVPRAKSLAFDRFHIAKDFNDHVVDNVRKDKQRRLAEEGNAKAAKVRKRCKYILSANLDTLKARDAQAGQPVRKGSELFKVISGNRRGGREAHYWEAEGTEQAVLHS